MKYLKIGGHDLELHIRNVNDANFIGETNFNIPCITIDSDTSQSYKESSLIHEALHAMNTTMDGDEIGHIFLDSLAEQIYQFLSDNDLLNVDRLKELLKQND